MKVELIKDKCDWREMANACRNTVNMEDKEGKVKPSYIRKMLLSEHSPIRLCKIGWRWIGLKSWVSVHFVRHKFGIEHFVSTQRTDRTGVNRDKSPQDTPVNHRCEANTQAIINISRRRLCHNAATETTKAWQIFLDQVVKNNEPELYKCCVKECVYRNGLCPEHKTCGYNKTEAFEKELKEYTEILKDQINNKTNINK